MTNGQIEKYIDLIFFFQGEEEVTRETLIKNHFTQRIAELSSQVNIRKLAFAPFCHILHLFMLHFCHPCPFFPVSSACVPGVHFQKQTQGTKLPVSAKK